MISRQWNVIARFADTLILIIMDRTITANEVRGFFAEANKQFEGADFFLHSVHFERDDAGKLTRIRITYENRREDNHSGRKRNAK